MVDGIEHPNRAPTIFVELSKTHEAAHCLDETRRPFDSLFLDVFVQLLSSIRLIGNSISLNLSSHCLIKTHNTGSLSNPTRHRAWPSLNEDRLLGWLKVVHSIFLKIFFTQHYCKWSIFHPPLLALKMVSPRCVYRASRKWEWKCDPSDFSPLNRGEPIHQKRFM